MTLGPIDLAGRWVDAGLWASIHVASTGLDQVSPKPGAVGPLLVMLARGQYGAKAALDRLLATHRAGEVQEKGSTQLGKELVTTFELLHQAHNFLIACDLFWQTLKRLEDHIDLPELSDALARSAVARTASRDARNHIEHVGERIVSGRDSRRITPEEFRRKLGIFDGRKIWFGPESFDVVDMHSALLDAGRDVAPVLAERLQPRLTVTARSANADTDAARLDPPADTHKRPGQ